MAHNVRQEGVSFKLVEGTGPGNEYSQEFMRREGGTFAITITTPELSVTTYAPARSLIHELQRFVLPT